MPNDRCSRPDPLVNLNDLALYSDAGWRLVPLLDHDWRPTDRKDGRKPGKSPRISGWQAKATADLTVLDAWVQWWPRAAWGVLTGEPSGVWVLDVDDTEALYTLADLGIVLPRTVTAETSRGLHFYFGAPFPAGLSTGRLPPRVDVRAAGGLVVLPPSMHASGRRYSWGRGLSPWDLAPAAAPVGLLELLMPEPEPARRMADGAPWPNVRRRAAAWLANVPGAVEGQRGDPATFAVASGLVNGFGLAVDDALELLIDWNQKCVPPWDASALARKVREAARSGPPRGRSYGWKLEEGGAR